MRRLSMIATVLFMTVAMSFAQSGNETKGTSFEKLSYYLQLQPEQVEQVAQINDYFVKQLGQPLSAEALYNNPKPEDAQNALLCNLKLMKKALTKEQYRKYVALINVTRANLEAKVTNPVLESYLAEK